MKYVCFIGVMVLLLMSTKLLSQTSLEGSFFLPRPVNPDTLVTSGWIEQTDARTEFTAQWKFSDGKIRVEYSKNPIHFKDEKGNWKRIRPTLKHINNQWTAKDQPHEVCISDNGTITMNAGSRMQFSMGDHAKINGQYLSGDIILEAYNTLIQSDASLKIDKEMMAYENSVKTNYHLLEMPENTEEFYTVTEEIKLPPGGNIIEDTEHGSSTEHGWKGRLILVDGNNQPIGSIGALLCYDAFNQFEIGTYTWRRKDGSDCFELQSQIQTSWLLDDSRNFPVVIDPLITGVLAEWGTAFMPSCYNPDFHVDSLLITVPGQITVTGFYVTTSFYADPLSGVGTVMGDGQMFFSTTCDTTNIFTAQAPFDTLPGTAYLLNFDFRDPLMCCFVPSCSETSFYFRMHLGRTYPQGDCNQTFVYYTPFSLWPFTAYAEGYTVESWGPGWTVDQFPICSDECITDGKIRIRLGVPPYTIDHPWMTQQVIAETPTPCDLGSKLIDLPLNVPNCPLFCPGFFSLDVPPPTVTDACGNVVTGVVADILNVKPSPIISIPEIDLCSNEVVDFALESCDEEAEIEWSLNGEVNTGNIYLVQENTGNEVITYEYSCWAIAHGCESDTLSFDIDIHPAPSVDFTIHTDPGTINNPVNFVGESLVNGSDIATWEWQINGSENFSDSSVIFTPTLPGEYSVCLTVTSEVGCENAICKIFSVLPPQVFAPNIFTPNGDASNQFLHFKNLELVPDNHLIVYNRWGNVIYETDHYQNSWSADGISDGTYYFILELNGVETLSGALQILR